jgi:hypothetical protein
MYPTMSLRNTLHLQNDDYRVKRSSIGLLAVLSVLAVSAVVAQESPPTTLEKITQIDEVLQAESDFFESKIRPVLVEHCYSCHAADAKIIRGGLLVDSRDGLLEGGDSGPALIPGNVEESLLLSALKHDSFAMPPGRKLPDSVIADFQTWIARGAIDPRDKGNAEPPRGVDFEAAKSHWAFQPINDPVPPSVSNEEWVKSPIDRFVLARLEAANMKPRPRADKDTLIRRASFDLLGLPPTMAEVEEFLADESPEAFEKLVDKLLQSPHYGERWGRYWLDLVRYADSNGADENHEFPNSWHYRDWVVRMFNRDQPLDQFITEQLAGDLLPKTGDEQIDGDRLTATGMLVIGPKMLAEQDKDKMVIDIVDEQIDTVSRTMLGLTIACARCHDHKFDPITAKDYYALAGIFYSTKTMANRDFVSNWLERPLPSAEIESQRVEHQKKIEVTKAELAALEEALKLQTEKRNQLQTESEAAKAEAESLRQKVEAQKKEVEAVENGMPNFTMVMAADEATPTELPIHIRGNHLTLGKEKIARGLPAILTKTALQPNMPEHQSGRVQLAQWLVSPENTLTSRVMVNRIWMWHFGQGLMRSPSNFGLRAEQPTHPDLLDYLASQLIKKGWSMKQMHRDIMNSATYQMASDVDFPESQQYAQQDPENRLLWRRTRRRLEAEPVRDSVLFVGGGLDLKIGGKAPDVNANRRAIYLPVNRASLYEMFSTFDYVETANHIEQRPTTTVPHQALFLLNSPMVHAQATALAKELIDGHENPQSRIRTLFCTLYARQPTEAELNRSMLFIEDAESRLQSITDPLERASQAWAALCRSMIAANEFVYID